MSTASVAGHLELLNVLTSFTQRNTVKELRDISEKGREIVSSQKDSITLFVHLLCSRSIQVLSPGFQPSCNGLNIHDK